MTFKKQPKIKSTQSYCTGFAFFNILPMKYCFFHSCNYVHLSGKNVACQMVFVPEPMVNTLSKSAQRTICLYS